MEEAQEVQGQEAQGQKPEVKGPVDTIFMECTIGRGVSSARRTSEWNNIKTTSGYDWL